MGNEGEALNPSGQRLLTTREEPCLRIESLRKNFEGLLAVEDVSL